MQILGIQHAKNKMRQIAAHLTHPGVSHTLYYLKMRQVAAHLTHPLKPSFVFAPPDLRLAMNGIVIALCLPKKSFFSTLSPLTSPMYLCVSVRNKML